MTNSYGKIILLLLGLALVGSLGACGKRASALSSPDQDHEDKYPFVYPDPATDPAPVSKGN